MAENIKLFHTGKRYRFKLQHLASTEDPPDLDYTLEVSPVSSEPRLALVWEPRRLVGIHDNVQMSWFSQEDYLYPMHVNLRVDSNRDGAVDYLDEATDTNPGGLLVLGSPDLEPINCTLTHGPFAPAVTLTLSAVSGGGNTRLWTSRAKTAQVTLPHSWTSGAINWTTFYAEGLAPGQTHLRLTMTATNGVTAYDDVVLNLLKVDITGPEKTIIYCGAVANNPTITLTADGQPVGGTYMWEIESGPAEIVTSSGNSAQIRGTAIGDAVVKATYGFSGGSCEATHQIKVVKPTSLALVPPPNTTSFTTPFVGYFTDFTYQVLDNDGDPLVEVGDADLTWDETKSSACTTDPPDISLGTGGDVNALGQFLDRHSPGGPFDDVPSDFRAKRTQTFTISGCDVGVRCIFLYNDHADSQAGQCDGNCNF
jgi:hypothetical protein